MGETTEEKKGVVTDIIFQNKDNGYTIALIETREEQFTAVGVLPSCHKGKTYVLRGNWTNHPTYGEQFAVTRYEEIMPSTEGGIQEFLASGILKGIGKKTAATIVKKFGEDTFKIIEEQPHRLTEISGIGEKKAKSVAEAFQNHREFAEITLYLQQFDIGAGYAMKLYKTYGADTIKAVQENPYQLVEDVFGIGFKKADSIAEKMGIAKDDPARIKSGIKYTLWYFAGEGHTFLPQQELCQKTAELLDVPREQINETLIEMAFQGDLHIEKLEGRNVAFLLPYYLAEQNLCKNLAALEGGELKPISSNLDSLIAVTESETGIKLSENQKFAVKASMKQGLSVITGGPGTGKTTIINAIINILHHGGLTTAIAAPTGRAAKRITETTGHPASTIHRLLEYHFSESEEVMEFGKTAENPLDFDAIIVDEASMIDLLLMNGLVSAIRPGSRLMIVGDADQLPSVGVGNVLRDIIQSEFVYCVKLTEIFRQAKESLIVVNAHSINKGEYPECNERDKDFFLMRQSSEKDMLDLIKELCITRLPAYFTEAKPIRDIQVLTPVRKGLLGCVNLNKELQAIFNPPNPKSQERAFGDRVFRQGDKVMQIKNNYQLKWKNTEDFTEGEGIFNGDVGFIGHIDKEFHELTVIFDEVKRVVYPFSQLDELELAYAVTVHKSQGSEFPIVIMPISWFPPMLATRNLLYTAVTRGKQAVILVGSENKLRAMIDNNQITRRYSGLGIRLKGLLNETL